VFEVCRECQRLVTTARETTTGEWVLVDDRPIAGAGGFVPVGPGHVSYVSSAAAAMPWHWSVCRATARDLNAAPYVVTKPEEAPPWIPASFVRIDKPMSPLVNAHPIGDFPVPRPPGRRAGPRGPMPRGFCNGCGRDRVLFGDLCRSCRVRASHRKLAATCYLSP
jgi:hypothetical protein